MCYIALKEDSFARFSVKATRSGFTYSPQALQSALHPVTAEPEGLGARLLGSTGRPLTCFSPQLVLRAFPSSRQDL